MDRRQLEALRHAVLHLHKALVDDAREQVERAEGRLTPHQFLERLMHDPALAWLSPMSQLIVAMDEWLDAADAEAATAAELAAELRGLLAPDAAGDAFQREYADRLQQSPAVVLAHAATLRVLPRR